MTPRRLSLPLTYAPKIEPVKRGDCTQTIRIVNYTETHPEGNHKRVGDLVRFFTWSGRPYHSKRVWVMEEYKPISYIKDITIVERGIICGFAPEELPSEQREDGSFLTYKLWFWNELDWLAALDFISPPTGEALRDVLIGKNGKIPEDGVEAQIIRWDYSKGEGK